MPRLSLYKPEKGSDYRFLDRNISEMFQVGGTDLHFHKYLGPKNPLTGESSAVIPQYNTLSPTNIQDLLLLENRDRVYDTSIYTLRGIYNVADIDFNLSQFGLFIDNDTLFMTVHINDTVSTVGRKPLPGDVIELPHLKDEFALSSADVAMPRFFSIEEVGRAAEGFSRTWYPHLYRLKLKKLTNSQQFTDILNVPTDDTANFVGDYNPTVAYTQGQIIRHQGTLYTVTASTTGNSPPNTNFFNAYGGTTIQSILGITGKNLEINDAIIAQAEIDAKSSGYETQQFYTLAVDDRGNPVLKTADETDVDASNTQADASETSGKPSRSGYSGYLLGDGIPPNGADFGHGISFPTNALANDYFLRIDMMPNRLFRYDGKRWIKIEDAVRHTLTNTDNRQTFRTGFINNNNWTYNQQLTSDNIAISQLMVDNDIRVINTNIDYATYHTAPFVVINQSITRLDFAISENSNLISSYTATIDGEPIQLIRLTLPADYHITFAGQWTITLYNVREAEKQSLSKALRPKADF